MNDEVLEKVKTLLALATSNNEHEAASAMAQAQRLMEKHNISEAMLSLKITEEDIKAWDDPLWKGTLNRSQWRNSLAYVLASYNNCVTWTYGPDLRIAGRSSDVQTVRYLFSYCESAIERFSKQYSGNGKGWINNYKLGVVDAIRDKLKEMRQEVRKESIAEFGAEASKAIVRLDSKELATKEWFTKFTTSQNIVPGKTFGKQSTVAAARAAGFKDGQKLDMGSGKAGLTSGSKGLPPRKG
jgi:hypothetical protein